MTIHVSLKQQGFKIRLVIDGHSNEEPDKGLVCAGVSALAHALVRCMPGDVKWRWDGNRSGHIEALVPLRMAPELRMFLTGLQTLDAYEPGHLTIDNQSGLRPAQVLYELRHDNLRT